jgi:hypothetical protein
VQHRGATRRRRWRTVLASLAAATGLMLGACGSADNTRPSVALFSAPLVAGGTFDSAATEGETTVLWFWSPT